MEKKLTDQEFRSCVEMLLGMRACPFSGAKTTCVRCWGLMGVRASRAIMRQKCPVPLKKDQKVRIGWLLRANL